VVDPKIDQALRELRFRHINALNTNNTEAFANNFMPDGVWEIPGANIVGRAAIREKLEQVLKSVAWHIQLNFDAAVLSATETEARSRVYFMETGVRQGKSHLCYGVYDEICVKDGALWRFAKRTANPLYRGPTDLSNPIQLYPAPPVPASSFMEK
jgi:uncharacterized protein (TIGR02246 family)